MIREGKGAGEGGVDVTGRVPKQIYVCYFFEVEDFSPFWQKLSNLLFFRCAS